MNDSILIVFISMLRRTRIFSTGGLDGKSEIAAFIPPQLQGRGGQGGDGNVFQAMTDAFQLNECYRLS